MQIVSLHSAPRSGSTWLQSILESHPKIITRFQPLFSYKFKNIINKNSTPTEFDKFINDLSESNDPFVNSCSEFHIKQNMMMPKVAKDVISTIVMKNVHHNNLIETFIKLNPKIKIIGIVRNPCAVIYSQISNKYEYKWHQTDEWLTGNIKNSGQECFWGYKKWKEVVDIFDTIKNAYPSNIHTIQYEHLVDNPRDELKKLFDFLQIELTESVINCTTDSHKSTNVSNDYSTKKSVRVRNRWKDKLDTDIHEFILNDIKGTKYEKYMI